MSGPVGTSTTPGSSSSASRSAACASTGAAVGLRQIGPVEPALAVHVRGGAELPPQRAVRARGDRDVGAAGELEHLERVAGRLVERLVARDRRDAAQLHLRRREREQDRDRVVVAGIAVDDDRGAHRSASTSSAVGSDVCAPKRDAASAPGDARAAERLLRAAPLEQRDDETGGERVARGGAVDRLDRRRRRARDLLPVLEQDRPLGAERDRDQRRRGASSASSS